MKSDQVSERSHSVGRRAVLKGLGTTGTVLAVGAAGLGPQRAAASSPTILKFKTWVNVPEYMRKQLDVFEQQYPGLKVEVEAYPNPKFNETMLANFLGNVEMDLFFNRDDLVGAWSKAGYLRPLDDLPGIDEYKRTMYPFAVEAMTVGGKLYGLPYVCIFHAFMYNERMVREAGFAGPPKTWGEVTQQALAMKQKKVVEYPLVVWLKNAPGTNWDWWNHVYAHGGNLFDEEFQPVFPDKDDTAVRVLDWILDGMYNTKIISPTTIELDYAGGRDTVGAGRGAFVMVPFAELLDLRDAKKSKAAADVRMGFTPAATADKYPGVPLGYTRPYSMYAKTKQPAEAWKLMQFLGGKDAKGEYFFPKRFFIDLFRGYGYKVLDNDPEVQRAAREQWGVDPAIIAAGNQRAKPRQALKAPWFSEWDQYNMARLQDVLTRRAKPKDALADSAKKARELAKG